MKMLTAKVVDGHLDLPEGTLEEGAIVTILIPEAVDSGSELTAAQRQELAQAIAEADRGEGIDGWQLLADLNRA
jgi:hypothetical protein